MGDAIETLKAMGELNREERRERHARWYRENMEILRASGLRFEERATAMLFREPGKPKVDFYPHTGRWRAHGWTFEGGAKAFLAWYAKQWSMTGNCPEHAHGDHVRGDVRRAAVPDSLPLPLGDGKTEDVPAGPGGGVDPVPVEPPANSPADVGYLDQERLAGGVVTPAEGPTPKLCSTCSAPIFWTQTVDDNGQRIWNAERKRYRSMPVDAQPNPDGNVLLFHRPGEGIVCRVLKKDEAPPSGAKLRTSHFATCPNAARHRRVRGGRRG